MKRLKNAPQKIPYAYILTPRGLEQKAKITARFLKQKMAEYEKVKIRVLRARLWFKPRGHMYSRWH